MSQILLEVIEPNGQVKFFTLVEGAVTTIGHDPSNDILIQGPGIADFHLQINHQQRPYQVTALNYSGVTLDGRPLPPQTPMPLTGTGVIRVGTYEFILLDSGTESTFDQPSDTRDFTTSSHSESFQPAPYQPTSVSPPPVYQDTPTRQTSPIYQEPSDSASNMFYDEPPAAPPIVAPRPGPSFQEESYAGALSLPPKSTARTRPRDNQHEYILIELLDLPDESRTLEVDTDNEVSFRVSITNTGQRVAGFNVHLEGVGWYALSAQQVRLLPGQTERLPISIAPPRKPSSRAGTYHFAVVVTCPDYNNASSRLGATLIINPYYRYEIGHLTPNEQQANESANLEIALYNLGNSPATFQLEGRDNKSQCSFEFMVAEDTYYVSPGEIIIQPGEDTVSRASDIERLSDELYLAPGQAIVPVRVLPPARPMFIRKKSYTLNVATTPLQGDQGQTILNSRLEQKARFGAFSIFSTMMLFCMICFACNIWLFRPVGVFTANGSVQQEVTIDSGTAVALGWDVEPWRLAKIRVDPDIGVVSDFVGQETVMPIRSGPYELRIETWTSQLLPEFFTNVVYRNYQKPQAIQINVTPLPPKINTFEPDKNELVLIEGEDNSVILFWDVSLADELRLTDETGSINRFLEGPSGSITMTPEEDTVYILEADNAYIDDPVRGTFVVINVKTPTPTPTPTVPPVDVDYFTVLPEEIVLGETVNVQWKVRGVDGVSIRPIGDSLPPENSLEHVPDQEGKVNYVLSAENALGTSESEIRTVNVLGPTATPSPTATPAPPAIILFSVDPSEVVKDQDNEVTLTWKVAGTTTNIELSSSELTNPLSNLDAEDTQVLTIQDTTQFILTAFNDTASSSEVVEVVGVEASPTPEPPPPEPTPVPPPVIIFFRAGAGDGTSGSDVEQISQNEYRVVAGSNILLSWSVENATEVTLAAGANALGTQPFTGDTTASNVKQIVNYVLTALNEVGDTVTRIIEIVVEPKIPPAPTNFRGKVLKLDDDFELSWTYSPTDEDDILGFRLYKGERVPDILVASESDLPPTARMWIDADTPTTGCVRYLVKAVYEDIINGGVVETNSSNNWSSDGC